jgi:carbamate kinase
VSEKPTIVIAFGGNALVEDGQPGTAAEMLGNLAAPMRRVAALAREHRVVISHGNGPQIGNALLQQETTADVPAMPVDVLGAMTQGQVGYLIEHALERALAEAGLDRNFLTVITMVEVEPDDARFRHPTKPIGPVYPDEDAAPKGYELVQSEKGWRRVIASPAPVAVVQIAEIRRLAAMDWIVICLGGGGIPVVKAGVAHRGVEAVVDKDLASALLARELAADLFVIATDVEGAALDWGKPSERTLVGEFSSEEMRRYADAGHFAPGSMGPKVTAAVEFAEATGNPALICRLDQIEAGIAGEQGTTIR